MTSRTGPATVQISAAILSDAADALSTAGRWQHAADLLDATTPTTPDDRVRLALAAARAALESDWRTGTDTASRRLDLAEQAVRAVADPEARWDLGFLQVRHAYAEQLFGDGDRVTELLDLAKRRHDDSPDRGRRGWAAMYLGLIADNITGERDSAPAHYRAALECAEETGDDLLAFEALRHLGDHDHDDGHLEQARERWERSTECAARAGSVAGTLAQQLLLAVLARDAGDESGAQALAREIVRWAGAIDATRLQAQARAFLEGVDPTAPPPEAR